MERQPHKEWLRHHRRLYLRFEPGALFLGLILGVPAALLLGPNPSVLKVFPTFSESVILDRVVAVALAKVVGAGLMAATYRTVTRSKRIGAVSASERLARDPRPRILYVRAFANDDRLIAGATPVEKVLDPSAWTREVRFEEALAAGLAPIGAMYAIGQPNEALPRLGAIRRYPEGAWEDAFRAMHAECALVTAQAGKGKGLTFEIVEAFTAASFKPILLCFPPADGTGAPPEADYAEFKALLASAGVDTVVPERLGRGYFVWFSNPKEGVVLKPTDVSFAARSTDGRFPGFSAVWPVFDRVVPGRTRDVRWHVRDDHFKGSLIVAGIVAVMWALGLSLFYVI
jgi:hypothetical protein